MKYFAHCTVVAAFCAAFAVDAQTLRFSSIVRQGNQALISAPAHPSSVSLQASVDYQNWTTLQNFAPNSAISFADALAAGGPRRVYRLVSGAPAPVTLPELASMPNRVFPSPQGFDTIQYAPDGRLGFIFWRDQQLVLRERTAGGSWTEQAINSAGRTFAPLLSFNFSGPRSDYDFQPSAILLYDSQSRPNVFQVSGANVIRYSRNSGSWQESERIANPIARGNLAVLLGSVGPNDVFHLAALSAGSPRNLTYASTRSGSWSWTAISDVTDAPLEYWAPPYAPRWVSMDVDRQNNAHIAYRSEMTTTKHPAGYPRARSELKYASNASGSWRTGALVMTTFDISGEAANGASIAVAPDGKPRIVSWYNERADTGSSQESRLYFHQQDTAGNWTRSEVIRTPDNYAAGDGPKGSGFSPYLRYDSRGRAQILFLDHAAEHFSIGQQEYAGNVRHGWWNGNGWSFETVYRQANPLKQDAQFPAFALSPNASELAMTVLHRDANWTLTPFPPLSNSTYTFRFVTKAIQ